MSMKAIFKNGEQITKAHSTIDAVMIEGFELELVYRDKYWKRYKLFDGYTINEVEDKDE